MADVVRYQQWLRSLQRQPAFINNYWCAMLAYDMEENKSSDGFNIPYYIVEEELIKEDRNVDLINREDAYASAALRHWLVHLLKAYNEDTNALNFEEKLRHFITTSKVLPPGVAHPLRNNALFHNLPSECKLWIFYKLRTYKKPQNSPAAVTKDLLGNSYYIVGDCRLYAHIARKENTRLPIDGATLDGKPWEPLYRFVHNDQFVLLCEDQNGWDVVWNALMLFKLIDLIYAIRPIMMAKTTGQNLFMIMRDKQRREFEETLSKLAPIPSAKIWENLSKEQKKKLASEDSGKNHVNILKKEFETMKVKQPVPPIVPTQAVKAEQNVATAKPVKRFKIPGINGKCWNFPQCPLLHHCKYVHPRNPCTSFPNCPRGWECLFLHKFCPNDSQCVEPNCAYEHIKSMTTYYRIPREPETATPRPVASVAPMARKVSDQKVETEEPVRSATVPTSGKPIEQPHENRKKCGFWPRCKQFHATTFFHPSAECIKLAAGEKCAGQYCEFMHGPCSEDGNCEDMDCIFDHYKSLTIVERKMANRQKQGTLSRAPSVGNLSRAPSVGNLSTISGRRKSVTFDFESDDESAPVKKESTNTKPTGILRPSGFNSQGRCKYGPRCSNKNCELTHPSTKCKAFPECPNGGACIFLHDVCENDGVCSKENCDFEHLLPHEIDNSWCNRGSRCSRVNCRLLHPQECVGRCPTPGECWKYHRPASQTAAAAATAAPSQPTPPPVPPRRYVPSPATSPQGQGAGPGPTGPSPDPGYLPNAGYPGGIHAHGYGQGPPFMHRNGQGYGYGPGYGANLAYTPGPGFGHNPGYPQGPGYGGGPGGYGHQYPTGPGYGHGGYPPAYGPEYGYQQGPGGYQQNRPTVPTVPPRPTAPRPPAPPPYTNQAEESELAQMKRREAETTRF